MPARQQGAGSGGQQAQGPLLQGQLELGQDKQLQLRLGYHDTIKAALTRWVRAHKNCALRVRAVAVGQAPAAEARAADHQRF